MQHWIFLSIAIVSEVIATSCLKAARDLLACGRR